LFKCHIGGSHAVELENELLEVPSLG
jgi:hypothetical protein